MITEILAATNFAFASFDAWLTRRRVNDYGIAVELNPSIRKAYACFGDIGLVVMIAGMAAIQSAVFSSFHLDWVLGILIGIRGKLFLIQLQSIQFEKQVKAFKASLTKASPEVVDTLPTTTSHEVPSHSGDDIQETKND